MTQFFHTLRELFPLEKNQWKVVTLIVIIALGAWVRLSEYAELTRFNADQVRDIKVIEAMANQGEWPSFGPKAGGTTFELGPGFYYLEYLSGVIFGFDPVGITLIVPLLATLSIPLFFFLFRPLFSSPVTLGLTALYSVSFYAVKYSRFGWNPNLTPFFLFAFLLILIRLTDGAPLKRPWLWYGLLGLIVGIGMQLHTTLFLLMPLMTALTFAWHWLQVRTFDWRSLLLTVSIVMTLFIPVFVSEWQTGGQNVRAFLSGTEAKTADSTSLVQSAILTAAWFGESTAYVLTGYEPERSWTKPTTLLVRGNGTDRLAFIVGIIFSLLSLFLLWHRLRHAFEIKERQVIFVLSLLFLSTFILLFPIASELNIRFAISILPLPFLFLGLVGERLLRFQAASRYKHLPLLAFSAIILFLVLTNLDRVSKVYDFSHPLSFTGAYGGISLGEAKQISLKLKEEHSKNSSSREIPLFTFEFSRSLEYFLQKDDFSLQAIKESHRGSDPIFLILWNDQKEGSLIPLRPRFNIQPIEVIGRFSLFLAIPKIPEYACRIGYITDVHATHTKSSSTFLNPESAGPLRDFINRMREFQPDVIVEGGDYIDGSEKTRERARETYMRLNDFFKPLNAPLLHIMGNHETRGGGLLTEEWLRLNGLENTYWSYPCRDNTLLIALDGDNRALRPNPDPYGAAYFIPDTQFSWLEKTLAENTLPHIVVFIHEPLFPRKDISPDINPERDLRPEDRKRLQAIFERYGVDTVISGHVEVLDHRTLDGTEYHIIPGFWKSERLAESWIGTQTEIVIPPTGPIQMTLFAKKEAQESTQYQSFKLPLPGFSKTPVQ